MPTAFFLRSICGWVSAVRDAVPLGRFARVNGSNHHIVPFSVVEWFRQSFAPALLREKRRTVRRRAVLLGLIAYAAHQTLVVLLDPRLSLERLTRRRRVFSPVIAVPDRIELAWAFTAVAVGYIIVAWLLWRSSAVPELVPSDALVLRPAAILESPPPVKVGMPPSPPFEALPRDPVTGRVVRQFDL